MTDKPRTFRVTPVPLAPAAQRFPWKKLHESVAGDGSHAAVSGSVRSRTASGEFVHSPRTPVVPTFHLRTSQHLARPLPEVFEFFSKASNLGEITPDWLKFRILTPGDPPMRVGLLLDYRIALHGIPMRWQSEITHWDPPHTFADAQRRGPYSKWVHTHSFRADGDTTWVIDHVEYASIGGRLVNKLFLEPQLRRIFGHRTDVIGAKFGDVSPPSVELLGTRRPEDPATAEVVAP